MNNHKEIMEELLQGKKLRKVRWGLNEYVYLNDVGELETESKEICDRLDLCVNYEEYIEYVDFNVAMKHIANGGKAKRKNWNWALLLDKNEYVEKVKWYDEDRYKNYLTEKEDILTKDWILL